MSYVKKLKGDLPWSPFAYDRFPFPALARASADLLPAETGTPRLSRHCSLCRFTRLAAACFLAR